MTPYFVVGAGAAAVAYVSTPLVRWTVMRLGIYDVPRDRKVHRLPTPTFGGIAIYLSFTAAFVMAAAFSSLRATFRFSEVFGLLVAGSITLLLGVADDRRDLSVPAKFAGQIFAGGVLYLSGIEMSFFWLPGVGVISLSPDVSAVLTIVWIVLLTNAVNYIDGLDGLAAGLTAIAAAGLFVYSTLLPPEFLGPDPLAPLVAVALAGACLGFLPYNFYPARIFMGDTGAMPLGLLMAGATISMIGRYNGPGAAGGRLALPLIFTPIVFLAVPLSNVAFVTLRRLMAGRPLFAADQEHIHYRLLRLGHSHRQAVLIMYTWAGLLTAGLISAGAMSWGRFLLAFAVAGGTLALLTMAPRLRRRPDAVAQRQPEPV